MSKIRCLTFRSIAWFTPSLPEDSNVPPAEPLTSNALVMLDPVCNLPAVFRTPTLDCVIIRSTRQQLDESYKRNAFRRGTRNGTAGDVHDGRAGDRSLSLHYRPHGVSMVTHQLMASRFGDNESRVCWNDWQAHLEHPYFGLGEGRHGMRTQQERLTVHANIY